jgi:hypothetical protein
MGAQIGELLSVLHLPGTPDRSPEKRKVGGGPDLPASRSDPLRGGLRRGHHVAMQPGSAVYEERYRWTPTTARALLLCIPFVLAGALIPMPLLVRALSILFGAWGIWQCVIYPASRKIALRVDHAGLTLGGSPLRYKVTARFIPWSDIDRVVLWQRVVLWGKLRYIGVQRRPGAAPLSPGGTGRADRPAFYAGSYVPPVPGLVAGAVRGLSAWRLDDNRLAAAIRACAPAVRLVTVGPETTHMQLSPLITGVVSSGVDGWSVTWTGGGPTPAPLHAESLSAAIGQASATVASLYASYPANPGAELQFAIYPWNYQDGPIFDISGSPGRFGARDLENSLPAVGGATLEDLVAAVEQMPGAGPEHSMLRWVRQVSSVPTGEHERTT